MTAAYYFTLPFTCNNVQSPYIRFLGHSSQHKERIGSLACPLAVTPPSWSRFLPVRHFCHPKRSVVHSSGKKIWTSGCGAFHSLPYPCPYYDSRVLFHRFHTGSVFSAIGSVSPALSSGFPNLILCCFCTTITPDDLSPRVSHPRDLILRSFSARKYRCFSVPPLTKSILISPNRNSGDFVLWVTFRYQLSTNFSLLLSVLF